MHQFAFAWACLAGVGHARSLHASRDEGRGNVGTHQNSNEAVDATSQWPRSQYVQTQSPMRAGVAHSMKALALLLRLRSTSVAYASLEAGLRPFCAGLGKPLTPLASRRMDNAPHMTAIAWEDKRSGGEMNVSALEEECELCEPEAKFPRLHQIEYDVLRRIQRIPGLLHLSLAVHYSLLPKVITPLLALIVWFYSLPSGASLITFVCAVDCLNTALKWAVQRPRPRWYCPIEANSLVSACGAWEVDLAFPSAHTMFFSGLAACASTLHGLPLSGAALFGACIGLSRNYLSMHWPTDTFVGVVLGMIFGSVWGKVDPYGRLLAAQSPIVSLSCATFFTVGLLSLMVASRQAVPPVTSLERTVWFRNALCSLSPEERCATLANRKKRLKSRNLKSKIPMLVTVWSTLAITGLYPIALPQASIEPVGSLGRKFAQAGIGVVGLGGVGALKTFVGGLNLGKNVGRKKGVLKALTYLAICMWTFFGSQLLGGRFLNKLGIA